MVVLATPERLDMSSMVTPPRPVSVSSSSVAASTRSRERATRGSVADLPLSAGASRPPSRPRPVFFAMLHSSPADANLMLRYRSVAQLPVRKETPDGPGFSPHHHRQPRRHGRVL